MIDEKGVREGRNKSDFQVSQLSSWVNSGTIY